MPDAISISRWELSDAELIAQLRASQAEPNHPHAGCRPAIRGHLDEADFVRNYRLIERTLRNA